MSAIRFGEKYNCIDYLYPILGDKQIVLIHFMKCKTSEKGIKVISTELDDNAVCTCFLVCFSLV